MDTFARSDLLALLAPQHPPCVSLYTPTHPTGREGEQDRRRLTQLIDRAEQQLEQGGMRRVEARELVAPLRELVVDESLWSARSKGLAVFLSSEGLRRYRLPLAFQAQCEVGNRFVTRQLLPLTSQDDRFLLLTLSQKRIRLYEGNRWSLAVREVPELPQNMVQELCLTAADQGSQQMHTSSIDPQRHHATTYHGHGGKPDSRKEELHSFFKAVDTALQPVLHNEQRPLILAGVDYELPIYRKVNSYPHLAARQLEANCDYFSEYDLHHEHVWPLVEILLTEARAAEIDQYYNSAPSEQRLSDIGTILPAAAAGLVERLWLDQSGKCRGSFDPQEGRVDIAGDGSSNGASDGQDLLDLAAAHTLLHGGTVHALAHKDMPEGKTVAARLRF